MKHLILLLLILPSFSLAKSTRVKGYTKKNGTYVHSHRKTVKNRTKLDNYSTKGNVNPFTGKKGTKEP